MASQRSYTAKQIRDALNMTPRTFYRQLAAGQMPFLEELRPRVGRIRRYRADLVDRYLDNRWGVRRLADRIA